MPGILGRIGFSKTYVNIRKAIEFLQKSKKKTVRGLGVGAQTIFMAMVCACRTSGGRRGYEQATYQKASEWMKSVQNSDGGWGETIKSYDDPSLKGNWQKHTIADGMGAADIVCCRRGKINCHRKGYKISLNGTKEDGSWDEVEFTATGFPKVFT